jgi:hypothetical protein
LKKSAVLESYDGTALKRLIETRWSGHYENTKHVNNNYGDLIQALLVAAKNKKLSGEGKAQAIGLLNQMDDDENHSFVLFECMLMKVLKPIDNDVRAEIMMYVLRLLKIQSLTLFVPWGFHVDMTGGALIGR